MQGVWALACQCYRIFLGEIKRRKYGKFMCIYSLGKGIFIVCFTLRNLLLGSLASPLCYGFNVNPIVQALDGCFCVVFHVVRFELIVTHWLPVLLACWVVCLRPRMGGEHSMVSSIYF